MSVSTDLERVLNACQENRERDLVDLIRLLRQPSISAQNIGVAECATLVESLIADAGFTTKELPTPGHPMIYGERLNAPGKLTVLIYGHYDVQPPEPLDAWVSPPFEPTIRDGKLFARGAGDNKGQFFAQICAARSWLTTVGELPVNVKLLIEGEEESGSPHLDLIADQYRELLTADLVYTSDGPVLDDDQPDVVYGVRGNVLLEITARGANHDLHSGNWGGVAPNPAWALVQLLATMLNANNEITIDGFHDEIRAVTPELRAAIDRMPLDQGKVLGELGIDRLPPPIGVPFFDRIMVRPTLNIQGFTSGYGGHGGKTIIPSIATVKLDARLVPDQRPEDIFAKIEAHIEKHAPGVEVRRMGSMSPSVTPVDHPYAVPVRRAVEIGFGRKPIDIPLLGGSLPDAVWTKTLGLPSFLVPYANADEDNHAPNENIVVERFFKGVRTAAALFDELANHA